MINARKLEAKVQSKVVDLARNCGIKPIRMGKDGDPDYGFAMDQGFFFFIEFKRFNEEPRENQLVAHKELRDLGYEVYVIDNEEEGFELINEIVSRFS